MKYLPILVAIGACLPPAYMIWSIIQKGILIDLAALILGTIFFLCCIGYLTASAIYERGEL